uniref:SecY-independent transporter protein n=1 Tax=Mesostigma viride TaxID=41882 RepID=Q8W9S4_MESVI|nr:SecY-independent transporter protein [Mesostigma viride]AAL36734.1 SecY-independent transporter protein [Mesostigma viride]
MKNKAQNRWKTHLLELKFRTFYSGFSFILAFLFAWKESDLFLFLLTTISAPSYFEPTFLFTHMSEAFSAHLHTSFLWAWILSVPIFIYQGWAFLIPSFYFKERVIFNKIFLFLFLGVEFAYILTFYFLLPWLWDFFLSFESEKELLQIYCQPKIMEYVKNTSQILFFAGWFGTIPALIKLQIHWKLLDIYYLKYFRRFAFILFSLLAAAIVPPDYFLQFFLIFFFQFNYEIILFLSLKEIYNKS